MSNSLRVIDFFCGAGGFSQGFKQMGFDIIYGYDYWEPAVNTFNYNYKLKCKKKSILDFKNNIPEINKIPNTEIIIGSPPCVSFSSSNKSGKADKSLGISLTETFLQIIAIKKHQKNSILKAWYMENVSNSYNYLKKNYTFIDLNLKDWAISNQIDPKIVAIKIENNFAIINSNNFNSFQNRKRFITGEIIKLKKFIPPQNKESNNYTLKKFKEKFISPFLLKNNKLIIKDPNYNRSYSIKEIGDHFYDSGIDNNDVKFAKFLKTNHPFMGKMSFPENENKPSRTITATLISNSREAVIYKTEIKRSNGIYRLPTVREASILMGFPINYQFLGKKNTKWKLIGNAVCVEVSRSLAEITLSSLKLVKPKNLLLDKRKDIIDNLNTFKTRKSFTKTKKNSNAKFRWHILKDGNLTVTITNFNPLIKAKIELNDLNWYTSIQYGTGKNFPNEIIGDNYFKQVEEILTKNKKTKKYIKIFNSNILPKIGNSIENQKMFTSQKNINGKLELTNLLVKLNNEIVKLKIGNDLINCQEIFTKKKLTPLSQVLCFYIVNKITSKINNYGY